MTHFEPSLAPQFRELLAQREAQLLATMAREESEKRDAVQLSNPQEVTDNTELAEEQTQLAVHEMQHEHAARQLEQVRAALRRLEAGQYGLCQSCGEPIELGRLQALPFAARCMRCQAASEQAAAGNT